METLKIIDGVLVECLNKWLTSVTIPYGVTSIGNRAFRDCESLKSVIIPNGVTSIGYRAFRGCSSLTGITIPDGVTSIGDYAFCGCTSLTSITIPDSVTSIGSYAFAWCSLLTNITIPNSVKSIDQYAFKGCSSLKGVYITDIAAWCNISFGSGDANPLYYAHNLYLNGELVTDLAIPNSVTTIDSYAFYGCSSLTSVTIPNGVTRIGGLAFEGCSSLTSVTIGNSVISIGDDAFFGCSSLTSVTIPDSVTSIGNGAFEYCSSLTSITIPDSVKIIGKRAFYGCDNLKSQVKNYKAFDLENGNLSCRCTSFSPKEWSDQIDDIELCRRGYHYCTNLFDIFNYYSGEIDKDIAIYECEVGDVTRSRRDGDSKHVTNKIKPAKRLYREDIIRILNGQS